MNVTTESPNSTSSAPSGEATESPIHIAVRVPVITIISVVIILSNVTNFAVLRRLKQIPPASRFSLINLSLSDLMLGVVSCLPSVVPAITGVWPYGPVWCQISGVFHGMSACMSIWNVAVVGLDRCIAITKPFKYKIWVNVNRYFVLVGCLWAAAILTFVVPIFTKPDLIYYKFSPQEVMCGLFWEYPAFCIATGAYIPTLSAAILVITSLKISSELKKTAKKREEMKNATNTGNTKKSGQGVKSFDKKAVTILVMTSFAYFTCWGPYTIVVIVESFMRMSIVPPYVKFFLVWAANSNSCINVFIYSYTNPAFRKTAQGILVFWTRCSCCSSKVSPVDSSNLESGEQSASTR